MVKRQGQQPDQTPGELMYTKGIKQENPTCCSVPNHEEAALTLKDAAQQLVGEERHYSASMSYFASAESFSTVQQNLEAGMMYYYALVQLKLACAKEQVERDDAVEHAFTCARGAVENLERAGESTEAARALFVACYFGKQREFLKAATDMLLENRKPAEAANILNDLVDRCLEEQEYSDGIQALELLSSVYSHMRGYEHKQDIILLEKVIVLLKMGEAREMIRDTMEEFSDPRGQPYEVAECLLSGDEEHWQKLGRFEAVRRELSTTVTRLLQEVRSEPNTVEAML